MESLYSWEERLSKYRDPPPAWRRAETFIVEEYDLVEDHSSWHDARTESGEPVEIKSCALEYADGRTGRFKIWEFQWVKLVCRGQFAFLVYALDSHNVFAVHMGHQAIRESVATVSEFRHSTMGWGRLWEIPWPEVIPLEAITFGCRHHFLEHYSEEEIEETLFMKPPDEKNSG
jgi:hypothetical protein